MNTVTCAGVVADLRAAMVMTILMTRRLGRRFDPRQIGSRKSRREIRLVIRAIDVQTGS